MDDVGSRLVQELIQVGEVPFDRESLVELARHQRLAVADRDDPAPGEPLDLFGVGIGDFAAADDRNI